LKGLEEEWGPFPFAEDEAVGVIFQTPRDTRFPYLTSRKITIMFDRLTRLIEALNHSLDILHRLDQLDRSNRLTDLIWAILNGGPW